MLVLHLISLTGKLSLQHLDLATQCFGLSLILFLKSFDLQVQLIDPQHVVIGACPKFELSLGMLVLTLDYCLDSLRQEIIL